MMAIVYVPEAGETGRPTQQGVLCAFSWVWPGTGPRVEVAWGALLVVASTLLGPRVNGVEAPDWYVGLRPAPVLDMLPEIVPFASKDFRINWPVFG